MPHWILNKLKLSGKDTSIVLKNHVVKDCLDQVHFDFNTIAKVPNDLENDMTSMMKDGLFLAILEETHYNQKNFLSQKFCTLMSSNFDSFFDTKEKIDMKLESIRQKYPDKRKWDEMISSGKKALNLFFRYGAITISDWCELNWGSMKNAMETTIISDSEIPFKTIWSPPITIIDTLSNLYPHLKIIHEYASDQPAFSCGKNEFENGKQTIEKIYKNCSKEAYKMYFTLWFDQKKTSKMSDKEIEM